MISGELKSKAVIRLCLDKLKTFIEDADQNCTLLLYLSPPPLLCVLRLTSASMCMCMCAVKYLGLLGLHKLMKAHPVRLRCVSHLSLFIL